MKKQALSLLLALCLLLALVPVSASAAETVDSGTCGDNLTWTLDSDGLLTIRGTGAMADYQNSQDPVTEKFRTTAPWGTHYQDIKALVVEDGVTFIGDNAFYGCSSLTDVTLPDSVTSLSSHAFANCTALTEITLPKDLTAIGASAFVGCSALKKIALPQGITTLERYTFYRCASLADVTLPEGLQFIGYSAFQECVSLTELALPESLTSIGECAFEGCTALADVALPANLTTLEWSAFRDCPSLTGIVLPEGLTLVEGYAFSGCSSLTDMVIPDKVKTLEDSAFENCTSLGSITLPAGVTTIEEFVFDGCTALRDVFFQGTPEQKAAIAIAKRNEPLQNARWHCQTPFTDVPAGAYFEKPVAWAVANAITVGTTDATFSPLENCTRGQVITFLWRAAGCQEPQSTENPFTDVQENSFCYKAILWAVEQGITTGVTETTFAPDEPCLRGQAVTFLWRAA